MTKENRLHLADQVLTTFSSIVKNFSWIALALALGLSLEASAKFGSRAECEALLADTDASLVQIWQSLRKHVLESVENKREGRSYDFRRNSIIKGRLRSLEDCVKFGNELSVLLSYSPLNSQVEFLSQKDVDALVGRTEARILSKVISPLLKKFFRESGYPDPLGHRQLVATSIPDPWNYAEFQQSPSVRYSELVRGLYATAAKSPQVLYSYAPVIDRILDRKKRRVESKIRDHEQGQPEWREHAFHYWMGDRGNVFAMFALAHMLDKTKGRFVDIGSGMGDPSLILAPLFPEMEFVGFELVDLKVNAANAMANELGLGNVVFFEQNLGDPNFKLPAADYYYFFNPVTESVSKKVAKDIAQAVKSQRTVNAFFRMGVYHLEFVKKALSDVGFKCHVLQKQEIQQLSCERP